MSKADLQTLPNVGPAVATMLMRVGVEHPDDLHAWSAEQLYRRVCAADDRRHDPCLLDTFVAVIEHANGAPPRPWWHYSRLRTQGIGHRRPVDAEAVTMTSTNRGRGEGAPRRGA